MANVLFSNFKELLLGGDIDLANDTIKITLVDTADYTFDDAHTAFSSVPSGARVSTTTLASKTIASGIFDAADPVFSGVTGDVSEALVVWKDTGNEATSPLIAYIDTVTIGFPVTPTGGDITIVLNSAGLFRL
jgi:hypothetical protein